MFGSDQMQNENRDPDLNTGQIDNGLDCPFTESEIKSLIFSQNNNKSPD
jgi:hypothetical protein